MLGDAGMVVTVFADTVSNPTVAVVDAALEVLAGGSFDCLIGFGGGSQIDTAKVVAALAVERQAVSSMKVPAIVDTLGSPVIAIPPLAERTEI